MVHFRPGIFALLFSLIAVAACSDNTPILIGFSGQLTGNSADIGVQARNGAQLAVEVINGQGGVDGRPLSLLVKNDGGEADSALRANAELIEAGVVAVIGHITSAQTEAVLPYCNEKNVVLISPTSVSKRLTGKKDHFFRVANDTEIQGKVLADHARMAMNIKTVVTLAEKDNGAYSLPLAEGFAKRFIQEGGQVVARLTYSSSRTRDWEFILQQLLTTKPQALLLICPAYDAVSLIQQIRTSHLETQILLGSWAYSEHLLRWGGPDVEGVVLASDYATDNPDPDFIRFRESFRHRFGDNPDYAAAFGYESVVALAEALKQTDGTADGLAAALTAGQTLAGVVGPFRLDAYGDVRRNMYIITVQEGKFTTVNIREAKRPGAR